MPPITYNYTAVNCPALPVPAALLNPLAGSPTNCPYIAPGTIAASGTAIIAQIAAMVDAIGRYGGGAYAVVTGLALSDGGGLLVGISAGAAMLDSQSTVPANTTKAVLDEQARVALWLDQDEAIQAVNGSLIPPSNPCAYLGSVKTHLDAITEIDYSGRWELRNGIPYRRTADVAAPTDAPAANLVFLNETQGGLYLWTGSAYLQLAKDDAPLITAAAEASNARQVTIQAQNALGKAIAARVLVRVIIADAAFGAEAAAAPNGGVTIDTGTAWQQITANKQWLIMSDANGQVKLTLTESTVKTFHVAAEHCGRASDLAVAFA